MHRTVFQNDPEFVELIHDRLVDLHRALGVVIENFVDVGSMERYALVYEVRRHLNMLGRELGTAMPSKSELQHARRILSLLERPDLMTSDE